MQEYKPYVEFIMAGKVAEFAFILTADGVLCGTNLQIQGLPVYALELPTQNSTFQKVVFDERTKLLSALSNSETVNKQQGVRLYHQKYEVDHYDQDIKALYLTKKNGGATIVQTKTLIIIGTYNTDLKMDNQNPQNQEQLSKRIKILASTLVKQGY